jgi:hypothetical protein
MRLITLLLVMLLMTTTPIGTGGGVHAGMLLHSLFPHVHIVDGQPVAHEAPGARIGAEAGADASEGGIGLVPTLPDTALALPLGIARHRPWPEAEPDQAPAEAPPDPPPTTTA